MTSPTNLIRLTSSAVVSSSPCWTCRRRRVQCDKTIPSCGKCQQQGYQCLGYKKPLVWNKGVASRGKMMGKTFHPAHAIHFAAGGTDLHDNTNSSRSDVVGPLSVPVSSLEPISFTIMGDRTLVDPILQDLSPITRYYIDYYARKLCVETVLHDSPGQNPFREPLETANLKKLIPLIKISPLILKSILATAARHATNIDSYPNMLPHWRVSPNEILPRMRRSETSAPLSSYHALHYKQIALAQLRQDLNLGKLRNFNHDMIIASISLFVWTELLESGKDTWRIHLDGMKRLVGIHSQVRDDSIIVAEPVIQLNQLIDPYVFDICVICDIMGTTLATPYKITRPMIPTPDIFNYLQRSEKISFLGCPVDLVYLILVINWQCWYMVQDRRSTAEDHTTTSEQATLDIHASIITQIECFEPIAWGIKTSVSVPESDIAQRISLASAYKSAIMIYAIRVLHPHNRLLPSVLVQSFAIQTITNLCAIPAQDPFFKCILWPLFIAGAETHVFEQREIVYGLFQRFWYTLRSANVSNAAQVLGHIWRRHDNGGNDADGNWTDYLAGEGIEWLFV